MCGGYGKRVWPPLSRLADCAMEHKRRREGERSLAISPFHTNSKASSPVPHSFFLSTPANAVPLPLPLLSTDE